MQLMFSITPYIYHTEDFFSQKPDVIQNNSEARLVCSRSKLTTILFKKNFVGQYNKI